VLLGTFCAIAHNSPSDSARMQPFVNPGGFRQPAPIKVNTQSAMTFANERVERKNRLLAELDPNHRIELDGTFIDHLTAAIRASSPNERQQALDKAIEAYENALDDVL
jgi:hypothetical protein